MATESFYFNLGLALSKVKNIKGAIAEYKEAIRINPDDQRARALLRDVSR